LPVLAAGTHATSATRKTQELGDLLLASIEHKMSTYTAVHLAKRPKSEIVPGETFELKQHSAPKESDLKDGQVIVKSLYLSLDPAMRGWLNGPHYMSL
jgi:NADPH-dependent curcumin reductase CurA